MISLGCCMLFPSPWAIIYINNEEPCRRGAYSFTYRVYIHDAHHYQTLPFRYQTRHYRKDIHTLSYITSTLSNKWLSKFHKVLKKKKLIASCKKNICLALRHCFSDSNYSHISSLSGTRYCTLAAIATMDNELCSL